MTRRLVEKTDEAAKQAEVIEQLEQQCHDWERRALEVRHSNVPHPHTIVPDPPNPRPKAEAKLTEFQLAARQAAVAQVEAEIKKQKAQLQSELHAVDRNEHEAVRRMEESKKSAVAAAGRAVAEAAAPSARDSPTKRFCATAVPPAVIGPPVLAPPYLQGPDPAVAPLLPGTLEEIDSLRQQWV